MSCCQTWEKKTWFPLGPSHNPREVHTRGRECTVDAWQAFIRYVYYICICSCVCVCAWCTCVCVSLSLSLSLSLSPSQSGDPAIASTRKQIGYEQTTLPNVHLLQEQDMVGRFIMWWNWRRQSKSESYRRPICNAMGCNGTSYGHTSALTHTEAHHHTPHTQYARPRSFLSWEPTYAMGNNTCVALTTFCWPSGTPMWPTVRDPSGDHALPPHQSWLKPQLQRLKQCLHIRPPQPANATRPTRNPPGTMQPEEDGACQSHSKCKLLLALDAWWSNVEQP